jgi:hypothetical protein
MSARHRSRSTASARRRDRRQRPDELRIILFYISDERRAGGRNEPLALRLLQEAAVPLRHEVRPEGHLVDELEAQRPQHAHSVNSAGKLGATIAATGAPPARSSRTRAAALWTCLACWLHTRTQLPQPMHRSGMTSAWPVAIRMALAGHSRTHV